MKVWINGVEHDITKARLSYAEICALAGQPVAARPTVVVHNGEVYSLLVGGTTRMLDEDACIDCLVTGAA